MKVPANYFSEFHPSKIPTSASSTPNQTPNTSTYQNQEPDSSQLSDLSTTYTYLHSLENPSPTPTLRELLKPDYDYTPFKPPANTYVASQHCSSYVYPLQTKEFAPDGAILEFEANNVPTPWPTNVNKAWTLSDTGLPLYPAGSHLTPSILDNQLSNGYQKVCYSCGTNVSSLWSTDANGYHMCNSCCCFRKINHAMLRPYVKPQRLSTSKRAGRKCFNCHTEKTSLWRRNNEGEHVCNSCGLYFKMHGYNRPLSMKKETIQTRKRKQKNINESKYQPIPMANPASQYTALDVYDQMNASYDALPPYSSAFVDSPSPIAKPPPSYCAPYVPTMQLDTPIANRCSDLGLTSL